MSSALAINPQRCSEPVGWCWDDACEPRIPQDSGPGGEHDCFISSMGRHTQRPLLVLDELIFRSHDRNKVWDSGKELSKPERARDSSLQRRKAENNMEVPVWTPEATGLSQSGDTAWVQDRRVGGKSVERSCLSVCSATPGPAVTLSTLVETCRAAPCVVVDFPAPIQGMMGPSLLLPWCQPTCSTEAGAAPLRQGPLHCTSLCVAEPSPPGWPAPAAHPLYSEGISSRAISAVMGWLVGPWWAEPTAVPAASDSDHWKSTASTWPLWTLPPECLRPPRAGWWRCWSGWILQTGPLSGVAHFCSWCSGSEASTCYKQPLSHWLVPQKAPPPSPRLPCATVNQRPLGVLLSHWSVPQRAPPPTLVFKRNLSLDWGKTVFWEASLPSSQFASFPSKVIILCLNNSSADLLASPVASKMNLGSVHLEILM